MSRTRKMALLALLLSACGGAVAAPVSSSRPGREPSGPVLLPNGWRIKPAGRHVPVGDLPLAMEASPDGRLLVVTNDGYSKPSLHIVDAERMLVLRREDVDDAWLGLAFHPGGKRLYSSAGGKQRVDEFVLDGGRPKPAGAIPFPSKVKTSFVGGISVHPDGSRLYAVHVLGKSLSVADLASREVTKTVELPAEPYAALASRDGSTVFVSLWGGAKVLAFDASDLSPKGEAAVGEHPSAMALSPDGKRLFVACASTNSVYVVDVASRAAREEIRVAPWPKAPPGSTPNALSVSPDGKTLAVANADNNALALVDISRSDASVVRGFVPTGWYPTGVRFSADGKRLFVLSGKGLFPVANPRGPQSPFRISEILQGTLSVLPVPDAAALADHTKTVIALSPYRDEERLAPAWPPPSSPIPRRVGDPSPIRHVFYVIRENRTYDQVLGDVDQGDGEPWLCLYGEEVTPNAHAIAREFVLFDNFYVNAEVSADGHAFSTGAYANDFVEKTWPMNYADRGSKYLFDGSSERRNPYGNIAAPPAGYLWDAARKAGLAVRSYGEFAHREKGPGGREGGPAVANVPGLAGAVAPEYRPWDLEYPDGKRIEAWLEEFRRFEQDGDLPALNILHLPSDHTAGTSPGHPTPRAMVAENDLALGRFLEAVSRSRFWKETAVFVVEDDAQDGPDHVDAHRSVLLVASPFARRRAVDSEMYTTCSVLRTIELILGLAPLSQCDAAARPLFGAFRPDPAPGTYGARGARVPLDEMNRSDNPGAAASLRLDLSGPDRASMRDLNAILWQDARGPNMPVPPPVRAVFLRPLEDDGDELEVNKGHTED